MPAQATSVARAAGEIRSRIATGAYPPQSDLPSSAALARELGASTETVRRALVQLDAEGLTVGTRGRPRVVREPREATPATRAGRMAADLRREMAAGVLPPGCQLPAETTLAAEWGLSRSTVRRAVEELEAEGLVVQRRGRRYVAGEPAVPSLLFERVAAELSRQLPALARPGSGLPSEHELASRFEVSRPTVRKALAVLAEEGLVRSERRVGWFRSGGGAKGRRG